MLASSASSRSSQRSCCGPRSAGSACFRELAVEARVAAPHLLAVAALGQPLERVLADRLQHPEARLAAGHRLGPEQVVVQERLDAVDDVELELSGDGLGALEREAADEDGKAREERLLLRGEEVVAPLRRGTQASGGARACPAPGAAFRRSSLPSETLEDRARGEQLDPRGRQLERERQPVEANGRARRPRRRSPR